MPHVANSVLSAYRSRQLMSVINFEGPGRPEGATKDQNRKSVSPGVRGAERQDRRGGVSGRGRRRRSWGKRASLGPEVEEGEEVMGGGKDALEGESGIGRWATVREWRRSQPRSLRGAHSSWSSQAGLGTTKGRLRRGLGDWWRCCED